MMRAPTSGLLRQWRCHSPSASVKERSDRRGWMRRRRASRSTWAVALVRAHCSRSSASGERRAASSRSCSAAVLAAGGVGDGARLLGRQLAPAGGGRGLGQGLESAGGVDGGCGLNHGCARAAGQLVGRRAVALARHEPVSATRAAARALTVAAIFSIRDACSTTSAAWAADSTAASKPAAYSLSDSRSSAIPTPIAVPTVRERATYRGKWIPAPNRTGVRILPPPQDNASDPARCELQLELRHAWRARTRRGDRLQA